MTVFMTPERWQQIEKLYHAALELRPEERSAFLDEACAGDEPLRREVRSLIASHDQAGSFIELPPDDVAAELLALEQAARMVGRTLGHYQLCSLLGAGGMGKVYRAMDTRLDREVAVKILPEHLAHNREALQRFEREAKAVAALSHPNILAIHDFGAEQGVHYAVMELLEGETLRECLQRSALDWRKAAEIGAAVAEGLAAAHAKGIIHRDLKPENIFLTTDGQVKILDFGIARVRQRAAAQVPSSGSTVTDTTKPGVVLGTIGYMSPEQVRGEEAEAPSDIFALGCVLYEMVSGQRPFGRPTEAETMAAILKEEPPALAGTGKEVPEELERVIRHCLEKRPSERFQSARDLAFDLRAILSGGRGSSSAPALAKPRVRLAVWIGAVMVSLLLVVSAWLYLVSEQAKAIDSLAVLPLVNASGEAETEYLSDGITEGIINSLSQLLHLRVMARSAVFRYKGQEVDPQKVGRELNVRAVMTGRMNQRDDTLIIGVELVDVADGSQLWGEQYRRQLSDIFAVQDEIARQISEKLRVVLTGTEQRRLTKHHTENAEAYRLYLKGRYSWSKYNEEGFRQAIDYFKQAIDLDPGYALAWAGLADSYYGLSNLYLPPKVAIPQARAAAERALALDETLAEAHTSLAIIKSQYDWDWAGAEQAYRRALELKPSYELARFMYGVYLVAMGRPEEAQRELKRARELDPLSPLYAVISVWPYYSVPPSARQPDKAIEELQKILAIDPNYAPAHMMLGLVYQQKGMLEESITEHRRARELDDSIENLANLVRAYAVAGQQDQARQLLSRLQERSKQERVSPYMWAQVYAGLEEKDQVFAWLEKDYRERGEMMVFLKVEPMFDNLRSDPRFADLLRRMSFAP